MPLDPHLWTELEQHGVTAAHWQALLRFFQCCTQGSIEWHVDGQGRLEKLKFHTTCSAKPYTVQRVSEAVLVREEG